MIFWSDSIFSNTGFSKVNAIGKIRSFLRIQIQVIVNAKFLQLTMIGSPRVAKTDSRLPKAHVYVCRDPPDRLDPLFTGFRNAGPFPCIWLEAKLALKKGESNGQQAFSVRARPMGHSRNMVLA